LIELDNEADVSMIKPCRSSDVLSCIVATINLEAFGDDVISVPECGDMTEKNKIQESLSRSGDVSRSVAYENDNCEAVFSVRGGRIFGNIDLTDGRDFVLEPCSAFQGCHVWKEEDTASFVDGEGVIDDISERDLLSNRNADDLRQQGIDDSETIVTFSVKYYYTRQFAAVTDDIELYMDQVTAETNQGYINSLIPVRIKIHCIEAADLDDIRGGSEMLSAFKNLKGNVEALRGGADAAALIIDDFAYCGIGYLDSWRSGNTVTAQKKSCALGYYTMGHELGHNFGCHHDRETTSSGRYEYGYGAFIESPYRTCMAYSKTGFYRKANIYSSPVATWQGVISGSATEDNARVIRENRFGMAAVGDESGTCDWDFSSTASPVASTSAPTTAPTVAPTTASTTPGVNGCREEGVKYTGPKANDRTKRTRNANVCEAKCKNNPRCNHWTWAPANLAKKQRKRCYLLTSVDDIEFVDGFISGDIEEC